MLNISLIYLSIVAKSSVIYLFIKGSSLYILLFRLLKYKSCPYTPSLYSYDCVTKLLQRVEITMYSVLFSFISSSKSLKINCSYSFFPYETLLKTLHFFPKTTDFVYFQYPLSPYPIKILYFYSNFSNRSNKLSLPESLNIFSYPLSDTYTILPLDPDPSKPTKERAYR